MQMFDQLNLQLSDDCQKFQCYMQLIKSWDNFSLISRLLHIFQYQCQSFARINSQLSILFKEKTSVIKMYLKTFFIRCSPLHCIALVRAFSGLRFREKNFATRCLSTNSQSNATFLFDWAIKIVLKKLQCPFWFSL